MSSRRHGSDRHRSHRHRSQRESNRPTDESSELSSDRYIDPGNSITNRPGEITDNDPLGIGCDPTWNDTQTDMQEYEGDAYTYGPSSLSEHFDDAMGAVLQEPYESEVAPVDPNARYCNECGKSLSSCHLFCSTCKCRSEPSSGSGKCIKCKAPTEGAHIFCPGHLPAIEDKKASRALLTKDQRKTLVQEGACSQCCRRKISQSKTLCSKCRDKKKISGDTRRTKRREQRQCLDCAKMLTDDDKANDHTYCEKCRARHAKNVSASRRRH